MNRLFFKIFISFWLAMALVWSAGLLRTQLSRDDELRARFAALTDQRLIVAGRVAVGTRGAPEFFEEFKSEIEQQGAPYPLVFDDTGLEVTGREAPAAAHDLAMTVLETREPDRVFLQSGGVWAGLSFEREGLVYAVVQQIPSRLDYPERAWYPRAVEWIAILLSSGLVCFALARYLVSPVTTLRDATRSIAQGDLGVRVGGQLGRRRDELSELGEDFDFMAGRLEDLLAHQRQLLSDISHELRSPLARLSVALGLARQKSGDTATDSLERIEQESERLNSMIGELLTLTRLDDPRNLPERHMVDLAAIVKEIAENGDYEARARGRGVEIVATIDATIDGYGDLLTRAVDNVVRNAIRYTPENTAVSVSMRGAAGRGVVITVHDKGPGVPEEALGSLFEPFYRVGDARDRASGGTGLGLSISERAVRAHGGSIVARNAEPTGLEIEIRLPGAVTGD
ncbi:MAG: HAMP domain-containing protein [Acidobacteria bacterium]|nr:HAMP domain-containing protein [Acidobacteriota bacterium]